MNVKILVAAHKKYQMPEDPIYMPIQVGAAIAVNSDGSKKNLGYIKDNTGDNISTKNPEFCELTAIYWAWKNLTADYLGLVHYRRYFSVRRKGKNPFDNIMNSDEAASILNDHTVIVPKKRRYYIETLYSHYSNSFDEKHLILTQKILSELYPEYNETFSKVMKRTWGYMFNMFVLRRDYYNEYCKWLFSILFELEKRIDVQDYSDFEKRLFGRISELLFNVWLEYQIKTNKINRLQIQEVHVISMESVNWIKKGTGFLAAKFFHVKYKKSF